MNQERRTKVQEALDIVMECLEEETTSLENLPESFQNSEKGEKMQEHIDNLQTAQDALEEVVNDGN